MVVVERIVLAIVVDVKIAYNSTGGTGIAKLHGFDVSGHKTSEPVQMENTQPGAGVAVTLTFCPTSVGHPLGQLGLTVPWPRSTAVNKLGYARVTSRPPVLHPLVVNLVDAPSRPDHNKTFQSYVPEPIGAGII